MLRGANIKMTAKNCRNLRERLDFGKQPIDSKILNGRTREQYTREWEDNSVLALIHCLHSGNSMTYKQMGPVYGWRWRTLKNKMNHTLKKSILRTAIESKKMLVFDRGLKHSKFWWIENQAFLNWTFNEMVSAVAGSFYKVRSGKPNKCEQIILDILEELDPGGAWKFNGQKIPENEVDGLYPDTINHDYRLTVDHFGERFHDRGVGEEENRIIRLKKGGYNGLIIWENELRNRNKCKNKIKEFIEIHALQNIQQVAI